jgi:hypothetical protein
MINASGGARICAGGGFQNLRLPTESWVQEFQVQYQYDIGHCTRTVIDVSRRFGSIAIQDASDHAHVKPSATQILTAVRCISSQLHLQPAYKLYRTRSTGEAGKLATRSYRRCHGACIGGSSGGPHSSEAPTLFEPTYTLDRELQPEGGLA